MNTRYRFIIAASLVIGLVGCTGQLDIKPKNTVATAQALSTPADLQALLVGAYNAVGDNDLYGGRLQRDSELLGNDPTSPEVEWTGTYVGPQQIFFKRMLVDNEQATATYLAAYSAINICNTVLANVKLANAADQNRTEGEAKFLRAAMLFELVRMYARAWNDGDPNANPGVPIVLEPTDVITEASKVPRSPVAAVYAQVLADLTVAEAKLPAANGFFATKWAAAAMLARVYLQKADYTNAAAAANRVIASKAYQLVAPESVFDLRENVSGINTAETIFAMQITDQDGINSLNEFYGSTEVGGRGDIEMTAKHLALYDAGDLRGQLFYEDEIGAVRTLKYLNQYGNIQVLRLAEMYLIRAESNFRAGTSVGATPLSDINTIRNRWGAPAYTSANLNLDTILKERRLELAFEGTFIHDLKRTRQNVGTLPYSSPKLIFPIPLREITTNPALVQNEGY